MGDPFFDLANFSINHELDEERDALLLEAYFGEVRAEDARALELMRFMSDFREAMWGVVQTRRLGSSTSTSPRMRREHFERLERTAAEPAFRAALEPLKTRGASRRPSSNRRRRQSTRSRPPSAARTARAAPPRAARAPPRCPCAPGP